MALGELSRLRDAKGDPDLGGRYADTDGLRPVCRLTRGADQRKDQPPHALRRPRDDRMVGVHVEPHSHANEQIVWMLNGKMPPRQRTASLRPGRCRGYSERDGARGMVSR